MSEYSVLVNRILRKNKVFWGIGSDPTHLGDSGMDGVIHLHQDMASPEAARVLFHEVLHKAQGSGRKR